MSSHHIIREKQEPALFILDSEQFDSEQMGQLLEWSPTVVVTADNYKEIDSSGIKIDAVVADTGVAAGQPALKTIPHKTTFLTDGISYLVAEKYPAVNVVSGSFSLDDYLQFAGLINLVVYLPGYKIFPVTSGFSKWKEAGERVEFISPPEDFSTTGLSHIAANVYQTLSDGLYRVQFKKGWLFIKETV